MDLDFDFEGFGVAFCGDSDFFTAFDGDFVCLDALCDRPPFFGGRPREGVLGLPAGWKYKKMNI